MNAKNGATSENFTENSNQGKTDGKAKSYAYAIKGGIERVVLACEGFRASEDDTVYHNERYEQTEGFVDVGRVCREHKLYYGYERSDLYGYVNHVGRDVLDAGDDDVGEEEHCHGGKSHHHAVHRACGGGKGRAHTEHQYEGRILLYDAVKY